MRRELGNVKTNVRWRSIRRDKGMDAAQGEAAANRETLNELVHASRVDCCM